MPSARPPLQEIMDNNASESPERDATSRRRSGRVVKAPNKFSPEPSMQPQMAKRKRDNVDDAGDDENNPPELDQETSDEDDVDSDDEATRAQKSRKSAQSKRPNKPSAKKAKINGGAPAVANHTTSIPRRPKKSVRIDTGDKGTGLFATIFGSGESSEFVAQKWLEEYRADDGAALVTLINCILQCIGCEHEVTIDDVRDPENIPNRLADLNTAYQEQQETEYPLISRTKSSRSFRELLVGFFQTLVELLHESEVMYKDAELLDNLHAWLSSMSSSTLRPFRHTATTISLAVMSGLVQVADTLDDRITNVEQQLQASGRSKNKARTSEIQRNLNEANEHRKICTDAIQSFFDTVFVHRYKDFDPKIRTECVEALGHWIWDLPTVFREPGYLRYLGWMLSDINAATRQEVLRQLLRIFKRDAEQLGHFIDRFRPRLVEIASQDTEVSVRVAAISVIDALRAAALLEPKEIDAIGELIFDNELRIRKAVVGFFVACVDDVFADKVEQIGGADVLDEYDGVDEDDFESPRKEWLDIKCLAETLAIYDAKIEERQQAGESSSIDLAVDILGGSIPETRISLASQVLYDKIAHLKRWQVLAGYLLYDHTTTGAKRSQSRSKTKSAEANFKNTIVPSSDEESILLKVLVSAVKSSIAQTAELDRGKRRGQRLEATEAQEEIALELAGIIPQLLNKFGAVPETATTVLQLEHVLDLGVFQQLRQDSSTYENLLDEIATQFNRHDDNSVISEAAAALLHARQHEELEEMADSRLATLWENNLTALRTFDKTCELSARGNLSASSLASLKVVLMKISKLAGVSDCVDTLDMGGNSPASSAPSIDILSSIVHRGKYEPQEDEIDDLEDEIVTYAIKTTQFYFMWRVRGISKLLSDGTGVAGADIDRLSILRQTYRRYLIETFSSRAAIDELRLFATGSLCDLHLTFATLRPFIERFRSSSSSSFSVDALKTLVQEIEPGLIPELIQIFDGAEKQFAKKTKRDKTLNGPAEDEDPVDDDEDAEDDEDENLTKEERFAAELRAERALCELTAKLVLSITARVLDNRGPEAGKLRRRLLRNQLKLGNNFKEVLGYLDEERMLRRNKKPAIAARDAQRPALKQSVEEIMDDVYDNSEHGDGPRGDLEEDPIEDIDIDIDADDDDDQPAGHNNDLDDDILGD